MAAAMDIDEDLQAASSDKSGSKKRFEVKKVSLIFSNHKYFRFVIATLVSYYWNDQIAIKGGVAIISIEL